MFGRGGAIEMNCSGDDEEEEDSSGQHGLRGRSHVVTDLRCPHGSVHCVCAESRGVRSTMEDAHMCVIRGGWGLFGVFDGHAGSKCAATVARAFADRAEEAQGPFSAAALEELCLEVDREFLSRSTHENGAVLDFSGSTGAIVQVSASSDGRWGVLVANVGDSVVVAARSGGAERLTVDHAPQLEQERARIRAAGGWVAGGRVDGMLAVSRAFGDTMFKQSQLGERHHKVIALPDVTQPEPLGAGESLLVCCDGVFEKGMSPQEAADLALAAAGTPSWPACGACSVVDAALGQGSQDNVTCMLIALGPCPPLGAAAPCLVGFGAGGEAIEPPGPTLATTAAVLPSAAEAEEVPGMRASHFNRGDFMRFVATEQERRHSQSPEDTAPADGAPPRPAQQPEPGAVRRPPPGQSESPSRFAPLPPRPSAGRSPPRSRPAPLVEERNHHIVTLSRYDVEAASDLGRSVSRPPEDPEGPGWSSRPGCCPFGIVLWGSGDPSPPPEEAAPPWRRIRLVVSRSPAYRAGIRAGMDIVALEGKELPSQDVYERQMRQLDGKQSVEVTVRADAAQWQAVRRRGLRNRASSPSRDRNDIPNFVPGVHGYDPGQTIGGPRHRQLEQLQAALESSGRGRSRGGSRVSTGGGLRTALRASSRTGAGGHVDPAAAAARRRQARGGADGDSSRAGSAAPPPSGTSQGQSVPASRRSSQQSSGKAQRPTNPAAALPPRASRPGQASGTYGVDAAGPAGRAQRPTRPLARSAGAGAR
eukprot:TRINITY_DN11968_c0_g1_i1.p1 TRINITY_DN11968_c0_g1~~TRINITY_DN11968_c0_g1_i1.p1  ORF type:complete len:760 (+),score=165.41 TRINITY_DN11968_c0_g1_i1:93-2372(+)